MSQPTSATAAPTVIAPTMNLQSESPFSKVPLEVLLRISSHLTTPELGALRLTCRSIEQSMFNTFMREFFTKRQFMLTEDSLQALIDISNSRLSDCLDHVIIGLNTFTRKYFAPGEEAFETRYRIAQADHYTLVNSGQDVVMLTEAFRNLKNLKTVAIRDYHSTARRYRDGPGATWASYGATTLARDIGGKDLFRVPEDEMHAYANKVMVTLFTALGNAGARPKTFELLRQGQGVPTDDAFNLFTKYLKAKITPVLEGIETFISVADVASGPFRSSPGMPDDGGRRRQDDLFRIFLGHMPNLKHLRLNFAHPKSNLDDLDRFIDWLATPAPAAAAAAAPTASPPQLPSVTAKPTVTITADRTPPSPPPVAFAHLEELNLGFVDLEPKSLVRIARKFAGTLKRLVLWRVTLSNRASPHGGNRHDQRGTNLWAKMLKHLVRDVPHLNLEHIKIGNPSQRTLPSRVSASTNNNRNMVWFEKKDGPPDELLMMDGYYPDDIADAMEEWEDAFLFEQGFHPAMMF
ncbi:hypothetical protein CCHL11_06066 [Colletotrichum chlorophyti]|uniref:F-box domain-containing protein n=1 Tax=Colletotrichum chlorophyti TaxID=708187 RepID=A0A1Q8RX05_9PEZI|nr:hypothetical protein CCHL11_06066 [Colletotrichum chlorophyti]